jgi:tetratricopeptide (TPR) repeat protein
MQMLTLAEFEKHLVTLTNPAERIRYINTFLARNSDIYPNEVKKYADESFELAKATDDKWGIAYGYLNQAFSGLFITQDPHAFEDFKTAARLFREIDDIGGEARAMTFMSYSLWWEGKYDEGLNQALVALRRAQESDSPEPIGWANYALGAFHYDLKDYDTSETYYKTAIDHFNKLETRVFSVYRCYSGLGSVMIATNRFEEAFDYIKQSAEGFRGIKNSIGESRSLNDMGMIMRSMKKYDEAEQYFLQSLEMRERTSYHQGISTTCIELGSLYLLKQNFDTAIAYLEKGLAIAETSRTKPKIYQAHELLGEVYKQINEPVKALFHKEKYFDIKTEVTGEQAANRVKNLQTKFATEKSEKEAEIERLKNVELKHAYGLIEEKNKNITDSIRYAKRIQNSLLTPEMYIERTLLRLKK